MPTAVSYVIDNAGLVVRLDSALSDDPALAGSLCQKHADGLRVPRGWTIDDRRESVPRLFLAPDTTDSSGSSKKTSARSSKHASVTAPTPGDTGLFDDDASPSTSPVTSGAAPDDRPEPIAVDDERGAPWMPRLARRGDDDETDDDADGSPVRGRLLGRAFGDRSRGV